MVNPGGIYAHEIGLLAGIHVQLVPMAHQYLITKPTGLPTDMPTLRHPSLLVYLRGESGGLAAGGYERDPVPWGLAGMPGDFNSRLLEPDRDRFAPLMENTVRRVPSLPEAEIVSSLERSMPSTSVRVPAGARRTPRRRRRLGSWHS